MIQQKIFPHVGPRSIADETAGGDFDGDMYWVSKNPQLLQYFKRSDPWIQSLAFCNDVRLGSSIKNLSALSAEELETWLQSSNAGLAVDCWMAIMDRFLIFKNDRSKEREKLHMRQNMLKLIDIYYEALNAHMKDGVKIQVPNDLAVKLFPHYMERDKSFTSTSILGLIYDEVTRWQTNDDMSGKEIRKLSCFDVEIPMTYMEKWGLLYKEYIHALSDPSNYEKDEAAEVIKIYKQKLYGVGNMEDSTKDIFNEALAVYHVTYNYAIQTNSVAKCGFAWKVAGSTLTSLYTLKQSQNALTYNPAVLREIFGS